MNKHLKDFALAFVCAFAMYRAIDLGIDEFMTAGYRFFPHGRAWGYLVMSAFCGVAYLGLLRLRARALTRASA